MGNTNLNPCPAAEAGCNYNRRLMSSVFNKKKKKIVEIILKIQKVTASSGEGFQHLVDRLRE